MKLNVPLIRQEKGSVDCGIAGVCMLLKYYGVDISMKKLKDEIDTDNIGTYAPQLASYLIKHGFKTEIITMHPSLFTLKDRNLSQKLILDKIKRLLKNTKYKKFQKALKFFAKYLEEGGKLSVEIPTEKIIRSEINNKRPLGALMTSNFLKGKEAKLNFHFNIITGIDKENIYANDPLWDQRGGKNKYKINDFFYGLFASVHGDLDNGSLILVRR